MDFARLVVINPKSPDKGTVLNVWDQYSFDDDLFNPSNSFSFRLRLTSRTGQVLSRDEIETLQDLTKPDTVVRLELGENHDLAATGIIDDQYLSGSASEQQIEISGRDGMSLLQDNECEPRLRLSNTALPSLADLIVEKYRGKGLNFGVLTDNASNRDVLTGKARPLKLKFGAVQPKTIRTIVGLVAVPTPNAPLSSGADIPTDFVRTPIDEARPHGGESEYSFLDRHAQNVGVMMWMSAGGDLIFSRPDYNQPPIFDIRRKMRNGTGSNNVLSGGARRNTANSATTVKMYGHTSGRGSLKTQVKARADLDPDKFIWPRVKVIHDGHAKDGGRARREAERTLSRANTNLFSLEYVMRDHDQAGILYCPDTLANVYDEVAGAYGVFYITARSIRKDLSGTFTTLKLVPRGAIILG